MNPNVRKVIDAVKTYRSNPREGAILDAIDAATPFVGPERAEELRASLEVNMRSPVDRILAKMRVGDEITREIETKVATYLKFAGIE